MADAPPTTHDDDDDDDDDDVPCYRHPRELTALRCVTCDRPICVDCAVPAAVGFKCPDDARTSRAARGEVPTARLAAGALAGVGTAAVLGTVLAAISIPFFGIILAYLAGLAIGAVTRRASGGFRDSKLARIAAIAAFAGFLALPVLGYLSTLSDPPALASLFWPLVAAIAAAVGAFSRAS